MAFNRNNNKRNVIKLNTHTHRGITDTLEKGTSSASTAADIDIIYGVKKEINYNRIFKKHNSNNKNATIH